MKRKKLNRWSGFDVVITVIAIIVCLITIYPMIYVISASLSDPKYVMAGRVTFLPMGFTLKAYEIVVMKADFWRAMLNSCFYVVMGCLLMLITTVMAAYPLTRPNLKFRKFVTYYLLIPMYFSGGLIPSYLVITELELYNTIWAIILPGCYGIWNMILCRTFMASLPGELIDSAMIDGTDQIQTLLRIVLPLSKPVLAVIMIYTIVGVWNSWFNASLYVTKQEWQPVQLYLRNVLAATSSAADEKLLAGLPEHLAREYRKEAMSAEQIKYAMITITTLPIIAVYPMFQKHFTKGIMVGSLKG